MTFQIHPNFSKTVNVVLNGKETKFAVRKDCYGFYNIEYFWKNEFRSFNSSWYSSADKSEIKEKLVEIVNCRVEVDQFSNKGKLKTV